MKIRFSLCLLFLTIGMLPVTAQTPTTQGKEFWASFMRNGYNTSYGNYNNFTLIASAKHACTVTVTNPITNWSDSFSVQENGVATYSVNRNQGYNDQMGGKANKGLFITSTDTISLYIANEAENSYDAANVLPASALGSQYMIQSYKAVGDQSSHPGDSRASFLVLATEDGTEVQITPSCMTYDNHAAGQPYTVTLNRGECYHVLNKNQGAATNTDGDFSGTTVVSAENKPIAVFNGNSITSVPGGLSTGYDHVFEQAMPTDYWGKRFVVTSTRCPSYMNLQPDQIKVIALNDNTTVTSNGAELFTLDAGQSDIFTMDLVSNPCTYLEADNPIAVFLYQHSHGSGNPAYGDPSMVWISPVEQTVYEVTFSTFAVQEVEVHYVNVVCYSENVSQMTLDGVDISSSFRPVPAAPDFSYTRYQVDHSAHTLRCPGGFIAHVYGIGQAEGYAYSVGSSAKQLTKQLYVNDILSTELPNGYSVCQGETVSFRVETNYEFDHVEWEFGDNANAMGAEVTHAYASAGNFAVQSVVFRSIDNTVQPFDTLAVNLHVNPIKEHDNEVVVTCEETYLFNGHYYDVPGDYDVLMEAQTGCDSIVHIHLQYGGPVTYNMDPITTCASSIMIDGISYDVPGEYDLHYETTIGCDSIVHLSLLNGNQDVMYLPPVTVCEQYDWFGETIVNEGLNHLEHIVPNATPEGCDSLYIQDVTIGYPPENPEVTIRSCDSMFYWGYWLNGTMDVTYSFTTLEGCVYDSVLHFILLPSGESFDTIVECDSYTWFNGTNFETLTVSDDYEATFTGDNGCESHLHLNLTINHTPPFNYIKGLSNVAVSTNFWPGEYIYYLDDSTGMDTGTVIWELSDNANGEWDFHPHGASCTIVAYTFGTKVLSARTEVNGMCDKAVEKRINCSGFGVDDTELEQLKVYPNPAQSELIVEVDGLKAVALVNILGQRIKETTAEGENRVRISVEDLPQALYLVQVMTSHGNKTQLISVTR